MAKAMRAIKPNTPIVTSAPRQLSTPNHTQTQTQIHGAQKTEWRVNRRREEEREKERSGRVVAGL